MLAFSHTIISLPLVLYFHNPIIIFLAAFAWHHFADSLLHWNAYPDVWKKHFHKLAILDVVAGIGAAYLLVGQALFTLPYLAAIAGGNMPDILHTLWNMLDKKYQDKYFRWANPWLYFHHNIQVETSSVWRGLISQAIFIYLAVLLLAR